MLKKVQEPLALDQFVPLCDRESSVGVPLSILSLRVKGECNSSHIKNELGYFVRPPLCLGCELAVKSYSCHGNHPSVKRAEAAQIFRSAENHAIKRLVSIKKTRLSGRLIIFRILRWGKGKQKTILMLYVRMGIRNTVM